MPFYRTVTHVGVSENHPDAEPRQRFTRVFWRESRHATPPSVPRGMSPHGARLMASVVDGVCSCGGGGVVASLVDDVEYDVSVEYGGSEEYDASLKLDVVVVCTKRTKDKEKHYLKTSARVITYSPTIQ